MRTAKVYIIRRKLIKDIENTFYVVWQALVVYSHSQLSLLPDLFIVVAVLSLLLGSNYFLKKRRVAKKALLRIA